MKNCLLLTLLLYSIVNFGQIPEGYYSSAEFLADANLKFELNKIIDNHTEFAYSSSNTDVWDILKDTDRDPNNYDNVILIYSGVSVNANQEYNSGNGWTREHVWAKSRGDFGTTTGPGTDVHALRPLDNNTNSKRNNRSFNNCTSCIDVIDKWGNTTGSKIDVNDWSFEPRNEVKGDVARMLFYMAIRYEGLDGYIDLEPTEAMLPSDNKEPLHGVWSTLMDWHRNDPVDAWEENRNDIIYYSYQNNRNPFIDFPELAEHIWGTQMGIIWSKEFLDITAFNKPLIIIYPNPTNSIINIKGLNTSAEVIIHDAVGRKILISQIDAHNNTIDVSELKGIYLVNIVTKKYRITKHIVVK